MDLNSNVRPAAAVPVSVKIPDPITEPIPRATKLHRPSERRNLPCGASLAEISSSMLLVRTTDMVAPKLPLRLALDHLLHFALHGAARHIRGTLPDGLGFLARRALQLLAFCAVFDVFGIHSTLIPAYFATSFFNPYPG